MLLINRCLILLLTFVLLSSGTFLESGKLIIEMEGFKNPNGNVRVGLYNSEQGFLKDEGVFKRLSGTIKGDKCIIDTGELPYGQYAVALLHDENQNKTMDYNWMKLPKEGFGFSNNPKLGMSAPSFEETKILLDVPVKKVKITVKYI